MAIWLYITLQTTTERLADRVFRAGRGRNRFLIYMEFVTAWDQRVLWPLLSKMGLLAESERLPVRAIVFVLRPTGYREQNGTFRLEIDGQPAQQVWFDEVKLWTVKPEAWWQTTPALMALVPLCAHGQGPPQAIDHASRVLAERVPDPAKRGDLLATLAVFGQMMYPGLNVLDLIGRQQMEESPFYQEVVLEGRTKQARLDLHDVIRERFGPVPKELTNELSAIGNVKRLRDLLLLAVRVPSLEAFAAGLAKPRRRKTT